MLEAPSQHRLRGKHINAASSFGHSSTLSHSSFSISPLSSRMAYTQGYPAGCAPSIPVPLPPHTSIPPLPLSKAVQPAFRGQHTFQGLGRLCLPPFPPFLLSLQVFSRFSVAGYRVLPIVFHVFGRQMSCVLISFIANWAQVRVSLPTLTRGSKIPVVAPTGFLPKLCRRLPRHADSPSPTLRAHLLNVWEESQKERLMRPASYQASTQATPARKRRSLRQKLQRKRSPP